MKLRALIVVATVAMTACVPQLRAGEKEKAAPTAPAQAQETISLEVSGMT